MEDPTGLERPYRGPTSWPITAIGPSLRQRGFPLVLALWITLVLASVGTGVLNVHLGWNGIPFSIAGITVDLTIYPPFLIAILITLALGPVWGAVPLYLANLASALVSGMPAHLAGLFALAGPVEIIILWGSMVILNASPELGRWKDVAKFLLIGIIATTASSLAAPVWNATNRLDVLQGQRVWRGWVAGDFLQIALLAAPALYLWARPARAWLARRFAEPSRRPESPVAGVFLVAAIFAMLGTLTMLGIRSVAQALELAPDTLTPSGEPLLLRLNEIGLFVTVTFAVLLLTTVLFAAALARASERNRQVARRDALTGCFNRRAFDEIYVREANRSDRLGLGLTVLFVDIDHFKGLNDRYGHVVGDRILRQLVRRMKGLIRETDYLFRWGGEEFVILLPHTELEEAPKMAERIREHVARHPILTHDVPEPVRATVSVGCAGSRRVPGEGHELLARADAALYRAKRKGRNRVEFDEVPVDATRKDPARNRREPAA